MCDSMPSAKIAREFILFTLNKNQGNSRFDALTALFHERKDRVGGWGICFMILHDIPDVQVDFHRVVDCGKDKLGKQSADKFASMCQTLVLTLREHLCKREGRTRKQKREGQILLSWSLSDAHLHR